MSKFIFWYEKILLLFVLSFTILSQAQEKGTVVGHILSEGQAVPFASILLKNTTTGTSSDENGNFSIEVPSGKQTIIVQAIGFKNQEKILMFLPEEKFIWILIWKKVFSDSIKLLFRPLADCKKERKLL
ncbi:carboxypeptidase-like regulatory domain-containing protein [Flavobacterium piscinae]|uniref:carboxypeptidase-like regulatory domain-containing protein n=1 Tax=Flavobacterium piscinae TaxID=2506424 RepID=UPI0019BDE6A8|nr:carboxypeptidase-like regulatory domain-containing protein [Flavobacterium piscinae]MBC8883755.1 carboxypeptidase-like regulatory domain-containing protein [Flavobacterium piscinae]